MNANLSKLEAQNVKTTQSTQPAILFDLDGTLVDTAYEHVRAWSAALQSARIVVPDWKIHRRIGMSGQSLLRQVLRETDAGKRKINLKALEKKHDTAFSASPRKIRLLPGAQELLDYLSGQGVSWAIATTGNKQQTQRLLKHLSLPKNAVVVTGDDVAQAKPSPDIFLAAAERLSVPMENSVVVGDSVWDMLAAGRRRALGVGFLAGGYSKEELEQSGAFRVYSDAADMLVHIEDLGIPGRKS